MFLNKWSEKSETRLATESEIVFLPRSAGLHHVARGIGHLSSSFGQVPAIHCGCRASSLRTSAMTGGDLLIQI